MTTTILPKSRKACATYSEAELRALPAGTPIVVYGAWENEYYVSRGRDVLNRGEFQRVGKSKVDGKLYVFFTENGQWKKLRLSAAVNQIGARKV